MECRLGIRGGTSLCIDPNFSLGLDPRFSTTREEGEGNRIDSLPSNEKLGLVSSFGRTPCPNDSVDFRSKLCEHLFSYMTTDIFANSPGFRETRKWTRAMPAAASLEPPVNRVSLKTWEIRRTGRLALGENLLDAGGGRGATVARSCAAKKSIVVNVGCANHVSQARVTKERRSTVFTTRVCTLTK